MLIRYHHIIQDGENENLVIFINVLNLDKNIKDVMPFETQDSMFLLKKNYHVHNSLFVDSCLLYYLYETKHEPQGIISNTLYIHLNKFKTDISMYYEGVINNKIKDLKFGNFTLTQIIQFLQIRI